MKTRLLKIASFIVIATFALLISCVKDSKPVSLGEIDSLNLYDMDSVSLQLTSEDMRNSLLTVIFNPWCDHCQAQAEEFYKGINKLQDMRVIMIGAVPIEGVKEFSVKYGLNNFENITFTCGSPVHLYNAYGAIPMPYLRLYDKNMKFVKDFRSTTPVNEILSYVQ